MPGGYAPPCGGIRGIPWGSVCVCVPGFGSVPYSLILLDAFHWPSSPSLPHSIPPSHYSSSFSLFISTAPRPVILDSACNVMKRKKERKKKKLEAGAQWKHTIRLPLRRRKQNSCLCQEFKQVDDDDDVWNLPSRPVFSNNKNKMECSTADAVFGHQLRNYSLQLPFVSASLYGELRDIWNAPEMQYI